MRNSVLVYGAYGYTGNLITDELLEHGIRPLVAGRDAEKIGKFAGGKNLPFFVAEVGDRECFNEHLKDIDVVIHCAGPFIHTALPMVGHCLENNCHYLDITGEYKVFEMLQQYSEQAKAKGIMLLPGAGFDVVPSDCLASKLKENLEDAEWLTLAFATRGGGVSRGTAKTMLEGVPDGLIVRRSHDLKRLPLGSEAIEIDYGPFRQLSAAISWGDISTAYFSTKIPNITVYTGTSEGQLKYMRRAELFRFLFRLKPFRRFLAGKIDKRPAGPGEERRKSARTYLYGKAEGNGKTVEIRLNTPEGYTLTARTVCSIYKNIINGRFSTGFQTPSTAFGSDFITTIKGVENWT